MWHLEPGECASTGQTWWRRYVASQHPVEVVTPMAGGMCPACGFYNHAEANVNEDGATVFCNNCCHVWRTNG